MAPDLPDILLKIRSAGFKVKLDTNGSRPQVLANLFDQELLDMVAMDVKAPLEQAKYNQCAGVMVDLDLIRQSIALIKNSGIDHEFRMTVLPKFHSRQDIMLWVDNLSSGSSLKLQNFNPDDPLDPTLHQESGFSPEEFVELTKSIGLC